MNAFMGLENNETDCMLGGIHTENVTQVFNVGTSIGKVWVFGEANQKLGCLTHIETLSVWDWNESTTEANFDDARALASESWTLDHYGRKIMIGSAEAVV